MLTLKSAAALLSQATCIDALAPLAAAIGFPDAPLALDHHTRDGLGIDTLVRDARIMRGPGTLRALLVDCPPAPHPPLRDTIATIAARLTSHAPHLLWLVVATQSTGDTLAIAAWSPDRSRPRIAALLVDRTQVVASDAETLCALAAAGDASDVLTHARWLEVLGREALTRRFYRTLERVVAEMAREGDGRAPAPECHELALLNVSRLLFLSFLESKGWLNGDRRFLEHGFEECMAAGGKYHLRVLQPLFFGTLNTSPRARARAARAFGRIPFLNGGLFARSMLERRFRHLRFSDEAFGLVFGELLTRFRFIAREDSTTWSEAAIDPEMLGRAFESLMHARERRASGAFYTPQALVASVTREALMSVLVEAGVHACVADAALQGGAVDAPSAGRIRAHLSELRVLDPACGSGAFLVHALEELSALAARLGDTRPIATIRRDVLTRSIFGVDINRTAVWLCELRLWLSVVIESNEENPLSVMPLPNLDRYIRVGDSLSGTAFGEGTVQRGGLALARLRQRYARASGNRKRTLERALERAERQLALEHLDAELARNAARRRDLLSLLRSRDLFGERYRAGSAERALLEDARLRARELRNARRALRDGGALPFAFVTHFPDAAARGGFDVVVGNPPWVRLHRIPRAVRARLRARYAVFSGAAWRRGAEAAHAGAGFAAQVDLASLFVERSLALLHPGATLALLLPAKLWRALAGGGVRRLLREQACVTAIEDWSESPAVFDAAVYPSLLVARCAGPEAHVDVNAHGRNGGGATSPGRAAQTRTSRARSPQGPSSQGQSRQQPRPRGRRSKGRRSQPADSLSSPPAIAAALHRKEGALRWEIPYHHLALDADAASPWIAAPTEVRSAFDRLTRGGVALSESALGRPSLGVKCGCNEAFVVHATDRDADLADVRSGSRSGTVERALLRPLLRGERVARWTHDACDERLVYTHAESGVPLEHLPPHAERWLAQWKRKLRSRTDAKARTPWWSLFRTGTASSCSARVVWADFARAPRALVLAAGNTAVALNSCYVLRCPDLVDAYAFAALLNSVLAAAWLHLLAEPARGGYKRYLAWTVALLPIPSDWPAARALLAPLAERAVRGEEPSDAELLDAALRAYHLRHADMAPLLAWSAR